MPVAKDIREMVLYVQVSFRTLCDEHNEDYTLIVLDIDECAEGSNDCSPTALCMNTPGAFTCACSQGYTGDGIVCTGWFSYIM